MAYQNNAAWNAWNVRDTGSVGSSGVISNGILTITDPGVSNNYSRYVTFPAQGGDTIRFDVMARAVSGEGTIWINIGSIGNATGRAEVKISGHEDMRLYSVSHTVPMSFGQTDIFVGIGGILADTCVISAMLPAVYINGSKVDLIPYANVLFDPDIDSYNKDFAFGTVNPRFRVIGASNNNSAIGIANFNPTAATGNTLRMLKSRATVYGSFAATDNLDPLGAIDFWGDDGAAYRRAARIDITQDAAATSGGVAGAINFKTSTTSSADQIRLVIQSGGTVRPGADNTQTIGSASFRWSTVYAGTGTINTSDGREKTSPLPIDDVVLDAWGDVQLITFKWLEMVAQKGDDARWHFGVIAQQVSDAFAAKGIDGTRYGLLCYDEWDDVYEPVMALRDNPETGGQEEYDTGEVQLVQAAGNRWGIRADQCLFLEAAYQRRRSDRIEQRLIALENK